MNPINMLEHQKLVLVNVYKNKKIFEKELRKSFKWLGKADLLKLYSWAIEKFEVKYCNIIVRVYSGFDFQNLNPSGNFALNTNY
jgi:hypothetical protein